MFEASDPNWLFSTIAQSSAAIVAIVGGFITASVLSRRSEKQSILQERDILRGQLDAKARLLDILRDEIETTRVREFLDSVRVDLNLRGRLPSVEQLAKEHPRWKLDRSVLAREYQAFSTQQAGARAFIRDRAERIPNGEVKFDKWLQDTGIDLGEHDYESCRAEYERLAAQQRLTANLDGAVTYRQMYSDEFVNLTGNLPYSGIAPILKVAAPQWYGHELERLREEDDAARRDVQMLEAQLRAVDLRLQSFAYPWGLSWGLAVLVFLSGAGIVYPLAVMNSQSFGVVTADLGVVLFILGLVGVGAFIAGQVRHLRR